MKISLNPQQKLAVQASEKPLLIVAGAGTGKTRTLTSRLVYLINEKGVPPERIAALTFTNKAAREMEERVNWSISELVNSKKKPQNQLTNQLINQFTPFIGTFHSFGARILRAEAKKFGRASNFLIYDDSDSLQLVKRILKEKPFAFGRGDERASASPSKFFEEKLGGASQFAQKISKIKNGALDFAAMERSSDTRDRAAATVFSLYEEALQKNNAFDFDDLIEKPAALFKAHPAVCVKYRERFPYILIDEYQDLNNKQYELVRLLAGDPSRPHAKPGFGVGAGLSVVGDDQQMIYGWRYANIDIFLNFEKDWPDANVVVLEENYRSTGSIIKAASALIAHNQYQKPKNLWTKNEEGDPVAIVEASDEVEEAEWISEKVNWLISELVNLKKTDQNQLTNQPIHQLTSIAILYRTNAQSRAIEQALIERGIPYKIFGGVRFYERKEIKDIVAALRLIQNPDDEVSRERLEKNLSRRRLARLNFALQNLGGRGASSSPPADLIQLFLSSTEYFDLLEREFPNADDRRENIAELLHFASSFGNHTDFLEQIALVQQTDIPSSATITMTMTNDNPINLMTIHLAKGLEFDAVFVAGCGEGLLPHNRSIGSEQELEEERRLMYVAMTRARKNLFLSFYDLPSRFLGEIPEEFAAFESLLSEDRGLSDADGEERYITL